MPGYAGLNDGERLQQRGDVFGLLWALPFAIIGVLWAISLISLSALAGAWPWLLGMAFIVWLFDEKLGFTLYLDEKLQTSAAASLAPTVVWTALLIFGPVAVWIQLPSMLYGLAQNWRRSSVPRVRMESLRNATQTLAVDTFVQLASITVYLQLGGVIPLPGLQPAYVAAALAGILVSALSFALIFVPFMQYWLAHAEQMPILGSIQQVRRNFAVVIGLSMFGSISAYSARRCTRRWAW